MNGGWKPTAFFFAAADNENYNNSNTQKYKFKKNIFYSVMKHNAETNYIFLARQSEFSTIFLTAKTITLFTQFILYERWIFSSFFFASLFLRFHFCRLLLLLPCRANSIAAFYGVAKENETLVIFILSFRRVFLFFFFFSGCCCCVARRSAEAKFISI